MNFPIQDIEQHIEEAWLSRASAFRQKNPFRLEEVEPKIWAATFEAGLEGDRQHEWEIEIQVVGKQVKAVTCDCPTFKASGVCTHVVAGLFQLRQQKMEEKQAKKKQKTSRRLASKLTTPTILKQATHAQMEQFVRTYARYDRYFAMRMKAAFVYSTEVGKDGVKYQQLMDTVVNTIGSRRKKLNRRAATQLLRVGDTLAGHLAEAMASREYQEVFYLIEAQHQSLLPYLRMMGKQQEELKSHLLGNLQALRDIYQKPIAPTLRSQIADYAIDQSTQSGNWTWGFTPIFFEVMAPGLPSEEHQKRLLEQIEKVLKRETVAERYKLPFLQYKLKLLKAAGEEEHAEAIIQANLQQPEILLQAVERAKTQGLEDQVERFVDIGLAQAFPLEIERQLLEEKWSILNTKGRAEEARSLAERLFLQSLDLSFYERLKADHPDWDTQWQALVAHLANQPYTLERRDVIADIYFREGAEESLLDYIEDIRSLDLLMRYDAKLDVSMRPIIDELYRQMLSQYLKNHLGRQTSLKVRSAIDHLHSNKWHALVEELVLNFRAQYPERHSLMEELAEF